MVKHKETMRRTLGKLNSFEYFNSVESMILQGVETLFQTTNFIVNLEKPNQGYESRRLFEPIFHFAGLELIGFFAFKMFV